MQMLPFISVLIVAVLTVVKGFKLNKPPGYKGGYITARSSSKEVIEEVSTPIKVKLVGGLVNTLFSVKPLWKYATVKARAGMVAKGAKIGVDWVGDVEYMKKDIDKLMKAYDGLQSSKVIYPDYYLQPFHAYDEGNLSWQVIYDSDPIF
jgi:hypothetical protein